MKEELPVASILLVDGHLPDLVALEASLAPLGQRLVRASSGAEALKRAAEEDFAAILLEVRLPELDGYQTARLLKAQERTRHVPLLFLTASQRGERQVLQGYSQGAVDYLFKPCEPDVLRAKVAVFVDLYQQQELLRRREARLREQERELLTRQMNEFLATLSHELRTPLKSILGWTQMLLQRDGLDQADLRRGLAAIERNARVQRQLVEDLLDVARITSGKLLLNLKEVPLREVVEAALESVRLTAGDRGVLLQAELEDVGQCVLADATRLQQVLWNLLTNAIKFTDRGGSVCLLVRREADTVRLTVRDTGRGIPPELLPHIFERFHQGESGGENAGLGLGLAIVRNLVELHGGSVSVSSEGIGTGATFTVQLPLRACQPERAPELVPALRLSALADAPGPAPTPEELFAAVATLMRQAAH